VNYNLYTDKATSFSSLQSNCANPLCLRTAREPTLHLCALVNSGFHLSPTQKTLMAFLEEKKGAVVWICPFGATATGLTWGTNLPLQLKYLKNTSKYLWSKVTLTNIYSSIYKNYIFKFLYLKTSLYCIWKNLRNYGTNLCNKLEYNSSYTQEVKKYLTSVTTKILYNYVFQKSHVLTPW